MAAVEKVCPEAKGLMLVPENHTRNSFYLSNVAQLVRIFKSAGLNVRVGSINPDIKETTTINLPDGQRVTLEPAIREGSRLVLKDFNPCTILLNNDLSAGVPGILEELHEQFLLPPLHAGWHMRKKSLHFKEYEEITKRFGKMLGIDPWLINPLYETCGQVNFAEGTGMECLQDGVSELFAKVRKKYREYGINEKPFLVVKADNGTYGMGIMTVRDAKDVENLNRRTRNKMSVVKDGQPVGQVIIQEGILTNERINEAVAEPVVYMMDRYVVGGFYRVHSERGVDENLNAPGSRFVPLAFEKHSLPQLGEKPGTSSPNRFYMYGVVARLAMLAASYELEQTNPDAEDYDNA
jgi:glutamate--cysteine ligase